MSFQIVSEANPLPTPMLRELANAGAFDEISNHPGAVRAHIYNACHRNKKTKGKLMQSMLFAIYQTGRHGPQNGYRLCLVHQGYSLAAKEKEEGTPEDDMDRLEKDIPQGHEEFVIIGTPFVLDENEQEE
ncbi:hypothetical protein PGQ11_010436 [Apiospora arundinis]|jgi:hypothetical protein|uniref:Uncharacterized protein n=1 Tax=Apiospora arundinis TaxID=335852 RepID=A0ABR2IA62_9PEZI